MKISYKTAQKVYCGSRDVFPFHSSVSVARQSSASINRSLPHLSGGRNERYARIVARPLHQYRYGGDNM
jgi:hypothetical protein